ncbi:hypothetical protein KUCAC02_011376 [Chaenocephalus aceratus]|uniref:Uncharacterized protein n=2 Tax=Chaenocephalus aceratus TaxID=36190 RepID=A0ACB9WW94_CHAAC|nr:hypothetical protein KUCAC02_011376 [Chaenocephalus aceratus]
MFPPHFQMLVSLFPLLLLLLSLRVARSEEVPPAVRTFTYTDSATEESLECDKCPPGTYLRARCTATQNSLCAPCPSGSFTELWNYISRCLRCSACGYYQEVKTACTAESDCQYQCKQGYYYQSHNDMCSGHKECPSGQEVLTKGTPDEDTVCRNCPYETYSDTSSALQNCTQHKSCAAPGLKLVLKGSTWHDSVCANCQDLKSKDGGDYLKEILPAFFVHYNIPGRRLHRFAHRLPTKDSKKQAVSGLTTSELHSLINTWVASATASQIRQLPAILKNAGVNSDDRLLSKLERLDSNLKQIPQCAIDIQGHVIVI